MHTKRLYQNKLRSGGHIWLVPVGNLALLHTDYFQPVKKKHRYKQTLYSCAEVLVKCLYLLFPRPSETLTALILVTVLT